MQNSDDVKDGDELIASVGQPECRRFYILTVFSFASAIQGLLWMTYSSVPQQASQVVFVIMQLYIIFIAIQRKNLPRRNFCF